MYISLSVIEEHITPDIQTTWKTELNCTIKGNGAKYLKGKSPVQLVYAKEYKYYKNALRGERNLKKLTRKQKEDLIIKYGTDPRRFVPNLDTGTQGNYEQTQKSR